ncbi:MAG: amino acid adenylation domain-containing protein, partial [Crocinitomicaceae bacterium]
GKQPEIPAKTDAYQTWAEQLTEYASSEQLKSEAAYWNRIVETETEVLIDDSSPDQPNNSLKTIHLNKELTESLKSSIHEPYGTEVNDVLLAALGLTVKQVFSNTKTVVELEGHGREEIFEGIDITRTIGWFTTMYPFVLDTAKHTKSTEVLVSVKDELRSIPQKGIGYGILKYLTDDGLTNKVIPQIRFNYLGGFDDGNEGDSAELFSFADEQMADDSAPENGSRVPLDIVSIVVNGEMTISIRYSNERFEDSKIQLFAESYEGHLNELVQTLSSSNDRFLTASDLTFEGLAFDDIEKLNEDQNLEDVYELSPLQKGIYFHWLTNASTSLYLEQTSYQVKANDLPVEKLKRAYDLLVQRHAVLRTSFTNDYASSILQVVKKEVESNFSYTSIKDESEIDALIEKARQDDLKKGFDLGSGSQMRLQIIELGNDRYEFIWSHHHILMDGWCISVLVNDFNHLLGLESDELSNLPSVVPYSKYIEWLNRQDQEKGLGYWKNHLSKYDEVARLPFKSFSTDKRFVGAEIALDIKGELFEQLDKLCGQLSITHNSFIQAIWGYLLSRYNNSSDVVFGAVVSGRPAELEGVEEMIGLFSNTVPVRVNVTSDQSAKDLLAKVHSDAIAGADFHFLSLADIQSQTENGLNLLNHVVLFQNYALQELDEGMLNNESDDGLIVESVASNVESNFDFNLVVSPHSDSLKISFKYNTNTFLENDIQRISGHLHQLIESFTQRSDSALDSFDYLTVSERKGLLEMSGSLEESNVQEQTLIDRFKTVVQSTPEKTALVVGSAELTYRQLDEFSDLLALELHERYDISADDLIGIQLNRNEWAIVSILGVLKSGAAYVPIDPTYPTSRKEFMIQDSGLKVLITEADFIYDIDYFEGDVFAIDVELDTSVEKPVELNVAVTPEQLAYVIYTSGSTGNPKGVMIEHGSIFNTIRAQIDHFDLDENEIGLQFASFSFDASVSETFIVLLAGGTLCMADEKERKDPELLIELINKHGISLATLPPTYLKSVNIDQINTLNKLITAGEAADVGNAMEFAKNGTYFNAYGPTETAICGTIYTLSQPVEFNGNSLPIGRPISNASVFVMSQDGQLAANGIVGEICIGGKGVARGYLNKPELSKEKFIENPFVEGERLYKTGDLGKWLPDGNLDFIGRKDDQVKVNGYRIELGEIEAALLTNRDVKEAVVLTHDNDGDNQQLVAYFVSSADLSLDKVLSELRKKLPSFMLPSRFVQLDSLPLTPNGKVDKKALPALDEANLETEAIFQAPKTEEEKVLAQAWSDVLKREKIGVKDSFYSLGGDSIKSIQIVARLKQEGYSLKVEQILKTPTIEQLTAFITKNTITTDQGTVSGAVELTPIQEWFFTSEEITNHHHFNQSVLLKSKDRIDETILDKCCKDLMTHHDALRMRFSNQGGKWIQENSEEGAIEIHVYDLLNEESPEQNILELGQNLQQQLNIEQGALAKLALFKLKDGDRLGLIVHHLVIDGVSWRILMEDLFHLYEEYSQGSVPKLPQKTSSYKEWASALSVDAQSDVLNTEKNYWESLDAFSDEDLSLDANSSSGSEINAAESFRLNEEQTELLKTKVHTAYQTEINDILLTAFSTAVKMVFGNEKIALNMEGHGREDLFDGIDVTRTIGWFTSVYPIVLKSSSDELMKNLISVKETLRKIPNKGVGYGILKYLTPEGSRTSIDPRITFNYLGEFAGGENPNERFDFAEESMGNDVSEDNANDALLDVSGRIEKGELVMSVRYSSDRFNQDKIEALSNAFKKDLDELIERLSELKSIVLTPSDLTFDQLSIDEVNELNSEGTLIDAYELSPLQQGMFFHWLADNSSEMYVEQTCYRIKAQQLKMDELENAYHDLVARYDILRTCFSQSYGRKMLQIVHKEVPSGFIFHESTSDLSTIKAKDLQNGFDLSTGSQMRLTVVQVSDNEYEFIWSHHHILMDGCCISLLITHFNNLLNARNEGKQANLSITRPYSDYISWLSNIDQPKSLEHWNGYLDEYSSVAEVPFSIAENPVTYSEGKSSIQIAQSLTERIEGFCKRLSITQNTFIQGVWGYLLSHYNANDDVVFGSVVSGRPAELEGVEKIVGLFINTIPVRVQSQTGDTSEILLTRLQKQAIETAPFHYLNLSEVQAQSELGADLINHIILFENYAVQQMDEQAGGLELSIEAVETHERTNYDFNLIVSPGDKGLGITAVFNQQKFNKEGIDRVMTHFERMINEFVEKSSEPLNQLNYLSEEESHQLLIDFNQTSTPYQSDKTVVDLIESQVKKTPDQLAVVFENNSLTYRELSEVSNQLGHYLKDNYQVSPDDTVAIQLPRNEWMLIAILGVMKSGGAYIPIDVDQPELRVSSILREGKSKLILDSVELEKFISKKEEYSSETTETNTTPDNLAYVIFTSGSSGLPKGVMIEHTNVTNFFEGMSQIFGREAGVFLAMTNYTFDISALELLWTLSNGYKVVIQREAKQIDPDDEFSVGEQVKNHKVTHIQMTPSLGAILDQQLPEENEWESLKTILLGGEPLPAQLVQSISNKMPEVELYNMYGPTETTIWSTVKKIEQNTLKVEVGAPIANTQIYILDKYLNAVPIGVSGEMYIGGIGVARGYIDAALMEDTFIENPFREGERIYRTGDYGMWLPNGSVYCLGRKDQQIKIRGFRVELGEIEEALRLQEGVNEVAVLLHESGNEKTLIAYITSSNELNAGELRTKLKSMLPEYMLPNQFVRLPEFPLNTSGKIDRKALMQMEGIVVSSGAEYVPPSNDIESRLVEMWQELLQLDTIGTQDDFFVLGGHSLRATQLIIRVEEEFGVKTD